MTRFPEPEKTPDGPAYEGRLLDRPDEEIVDQGAAFDLRTLVSRRRVLGIAGAGASAVALTTLTPSLAAAATETSSKWTYEAEIPQETNGPYPADGTNGVDVLGNSGIVRRNVRRNFDGSSKQPGVPLTLTFSMVDLAHKSKPFNHVAVYIWQCNAQGLYSLYSDGVENDTFLRGIQVADHDGQLTFDTIVPGCYTGRWPHIHFEVYPTRASATDVTNAIATSQLAIPKRVLKKVYRHADYAGSTANLKGVGAKISDDDIFGQGNWKLEVPTFKHRPGHGYRAEIKVRVDTRTQ